MRIACIGYFEGSGGAERQLLMLASYLAEKNNEVYVIALSSNIICFEYSKRIKLVDLAKDECKNKTKIISRFKLLRKKLYEIEPDITVHFWYQSVYFASLMDRKKIGKIVFSERGDPGDKEYAGLLGIIRRLTIHCVSGFVFQSDGARDFFGKKVRDRSIVIHNPVSVPQDQISEPCKNRDNIIVTVGRLHPQKNHKLLIEAFQEVSFDFPNYELLIYGEGEKRKELQELIEKIGLTNKVFLMGTRKDIYNAIYPASIFVLSSDFEGMPNVLMEAMALGVPCISTDCKPGGARELIKNEINGLIVPINDKLALEKAIRRMLEDPAFAERLAEKAQDITSTHSKNEIFQKWDRFLQTIATEKE
jgi:glycosyltransferase involved in cell wall biosynthesis